MEIVAGKHGSFFVVTDKTDTDTLKKLADISFDEFGRYNAWATMKKISHLSDVDYANKNGLNIEILKKFDRFAEAVDYKATQDLMFFIATENGREDIEADVDLQKINPNNFKNSFSYPAPREVSGLITDSLYIKNDEIPRMMKNVGISIVRSVVSYFVKWNNITYEVDVTPATPNLPRSNFNGRELVIGERCYVFQSDDWRYIKKLEYTFNKEKQERKTSWFKVDKPENEIFDIVLKKLFKEEHKQIVIKALYQKYLELKDSRYDYRSVLIYDFHRFRSRVLLENRFLKPNVNALLPPDIYYLMVENQRSAHLAVTIDRINTYWHDHDWDKLLKSEPCFSILAGRSEAERNRLLQNLDFVTNAKLKYWTENSLEAHLEDIIHSLPKVLRYCSVAKGMDTQRREYMRLRSMMYSFWVYNPYTARHKMVRLDKYIKIDIPVNERVRTDFINKAHSFIGRKMATKEMLQIKYGFSDEQIRDAANLYDAALRIKQTQS